MPASKPAVLLVHVLSFSTALGCSRLDALRGDAGADKDASTAATESIMASASAATSAASSASSASSASGVTDAGVERRPGRAHARSEALRTRGVLATSPALAPHLAVLEKQFGAPLPPLDVQVSPLAFDRRSAFLVSLGGKPWGEAKPFVFVEDASVMAWSRDRPTAGITPPHGPLAIAAGPRGRVAMAVCDPPTSTVALRLWDDDGTPFADFKALEVERCDELSLFYWPKKGWIVAATRPTVTRAQLVTEDGSNAWGTGIDIGARPESPNPVAIAADSEESVIVVQYAPPLALAFRYDARGSSLWPAAVELPTSGKPTSKSPRPILDREGNGVVRATLPSSDAPLSAGPGGGRTNVVDVEIRSTGGISPRGRAPR